MRQLTGLPCVYAASYGARVAGTAYARGIDSSRTWKYGEIKPREYTEDRLTDESPCVLVLEFGPIEFYGRRRRSAKDHIGGLFRDHHHCGVSVAADDVREDGGIGDAQPIDTS
jgi:hypothetical protein